ncbi:hypothetical protein MPTK1_3g12950 [Marchantia polymorpha subsp. ruderalis]|uniref:Uncharacterized protein n=2 Tax=Marchantia polymorpha TaxID=3197 RepID=A0AAF6B086_MARPO|nr:hypothetical protein MARPO_0050s0087 [Marchantia polymorpha]BBN05420.1 hypothetical protein Mp_3g12950 [Marchantia polymorpha subsp. ruderalis]|eukprot:PTQ38633.1 hypothetical protein MARPO_0050s0087 [Marchantia polymorpha]
MNVNLPNLSRNDLRGRTARGLCKWNNEFSVVEREERVTSLRIRGAEKKTQLSLQHKLGHHDLLRLDRGHILGLGPQICVADEFRKSAVTCHTKEVKCSTEGQGQTQTIKNETISTNKAPLQSKEMSPKLDDGGTGLPPRDGDGGGGGGGGGGGWGGGGFVFWALLLLIGFLRDRELDKPYTGLKPKKKQRRRQLT